MKRIGNLYTSIYDINNLYRADRLAQQGKAKQYGVIVHNRNQDENLHTLHQMLINKTYNTSAYAVFKVFEPKERDVYRLPYFPDRILHYAILNILEPVFMSVFTADSYSCIKGKGIHNTLRNLKKALKDVEGTMYCLKFDITKFYPSVNHDILKDLLRKKIKDNDLLWLLDEIIDSAPGLPIGNYLSQYLANFYLTYFDHWLKEVKKVKYYFRYADDIVILSDSKVHLHTLLAECRAYLLNNLKLIIKPNYQVFPVDARGIDFVGYVCFHTHTKLRKSIKQRFARAVKAGKGPASIASYKGWAKHGNCRNLIKKLLSNEEIQ
ncbi:RNA-directed DNA polymerase [Emticicia sp. BO119]|uniref:RNA-directed DNA polymerase n=1 Tax=Emticicia sp. BO119 TaxID=2757768 RepID=UPI0015F1178F|nr:RNA-directed DNA polymerase [Emticicia sp. BO119]MBA4852041.1 RNA-directed DNA polymerase [Emticicia sp. BO119]